MRTEDCFLHKEEDVVRWAFSQKRSKESEVYIASAVWRPRDSHIRMYMYINKKEKKEDRAAGSRLVRSIDTEISGRGNPEKKRNKKNDFFI